MIKKYVKKPVVIEAVEWTGTNIDEIKEFCKNACDIDVRDRGESVIIGQKITIHTLEGDMKASKGDYIIKGVNGEFYPCKPDVFAKTYEIYKGAYGGK